MSAHNRVILGVFGFALVGALSACGSGSTEPEESGAIPVFTAHLTDLTRIELIVPTGSISGDEIKGHAFVRADGMETIPVYAPVDMVLTSATWVGQSDDYGFQFDINSRFRLRLGHITDPRADIEALVPQTDPSSIFSDVGPLPLRAGDLIGHTAGTVQANSFDFGLYDLDMEIQSPNADRYRSLQDFEKLNSVCPFEYFAPGIRDEYESLFGTIGGFLVPGAPSRTISDVVGGAGLAGEWHLTSHLPDGTYRERFAVGMDLGGTAVRVAGIGSSTDVVGAPDPQTIQDEACYAGNGAFVYLQLASTTELDAVVGAGSCPPSFPVGDERRYVR